MTNGFVVQQQNSCAHATHNKRHANNFNGFVRELGLRSTLAILILAGMVTHASAQTACVTATTAWKNTAFANTADVIDVYFDASPGSAGSDGVIGLSKGTATQYTQLAVAVRFNTSNTIDARNGGAYKADTVLRYTPGAMYAFRIAVNTSAGTYSVYVTPPAGVEQLIANNYKLRTEQSSVAVLNNWAACASIGSVQVCNFECVSAGNKPPVAVVTSAPTEGIAPLAVQLDGSASSDPDGTIAGYAWDFGDGTTGSGAKVSRTYTTPGTYTATLTVTDNAGVSTSASAAITANEPLPATSCVNSTIAWQNSAMGPFNDLFTVEFDATPQAAALDGLVGLSQSSGTTFSAFAAMVRFSVDNRIDARNGSVYAATSVVPYTAGVQYYFRVVVDVPARKYDAFVTPAGGQEVQFASGYSFRTEQQSITSIANWAVYSGASVLQVCNLEARAQVGNKPPVASASVTPTSGIAPLTVQCNGTGSSDPDGTIAKYVWNFGDGTANAATATASHIYSAAGTYNVTLTVTDNAGATATANATVTVVANQPPKAVITCGTTTGTAPFTASFDGKNSSDPDGTIVKYEWDFGDGSAKATTSATSHTYASAGNYTVTLTVTDNAGATASANVNIAVAAPNQPPKAVIACTVTTGPAPLAVGFDGRNCSDSDGTIVSYAWNFGDGTTGTGATINHTYAQAGTYTTTLTVADNAGATASATTGITVTVPLNCVDSSTAWQNSAIGPFADLFTVEFDATPQVAALDGLVGFSQATGNTFSAYAAVVRFSVDNRIDARNGSVYAATSTVPYTAGIQYHFRVVVDVAARKYDAYVTPAGGQEVQIASGYAFRTEQQSITSITNWAVYSGTGVLQVCELKANAVIRNKPPVASATVTPTSGNAPLTIQCNGTASSDPDGTITKYVWNFGDGTANATTATASHTYTAAGNYNVTLTVTDNAGETASKTVAVSALGQPALAVGTSALDFGTSNTTLTFEVWNSGGSTLSYTVADNAAWLSVTPSSGQSTGERDTITATIDRSGLAAGTYQGNITVTSSTGTVLTIAVAMQCATVPQAKLKPIARWDVVPYTRINPDKAFNCGVVAFSKYGISKVRFTITGQGYKGASPIDVTSMSLNEQSGVWEYWTPISVSNFTTNGVITVEATVYGNDGGVRDKSTDGGGLGLDALPLVVNATGTYAAPEIWVSTSGNDSTGTVGDSTKPCATIGKAIDKIRAWRSAQGLGNNADGGIVRLTPGTHACSAGGVGSAVACDTQWVTITTASGGTQANTIVTPGGIQGIRKLLLRGITLKGAGTFSMGSADRTQAWVWADNCALIGSGMGVTGSHPLSLEFGRMYYTGTSITQVTQATNLATLCRGMTITHISDDAFQNVPMVVNCTVDDINPLSTGAHADVWQHHSGNSSNRRDDNVILYGLKATNVMYQTLFIRADVSTAPTYAQGMAFVNVYMAMNSNGFGYAGWYRWCDHLLWWNCSFPVKGLGITNDTYAGVKQDTRILNFSCKGSQFAFLTINGSDANIDFTDWNNNHFTSSSLTRGTKFTTGSEMLDSSGVPLAGSPLLDRFTPVVPVDARNKARTGMADVGAFER